MELHRAVVRHVEHHLVVSRSAAVDHVATAALAEVVVAGIVVADAAGGVKTQLLMVHRNQMPLIS